MMDIVEHLRDLKLHNAADEIERLRDLLGKTNALARIRAENLAACQADAERYRWLKRYRTRERYSGELLIEFECDFDNYNNLDAAIDAAIVRAAAEIGEGMK